jgi:predicted HTH domain antitoxin
LKRWKTAKRRHKKAMPKLKELPSEVVDLVRARLREGARDEHLVEWAALGFEEQLEALYERFRRGEISFGYLAEELGLSVWEAETLLEKLGRPTTNL